MEQRRSEYPEFDVQPIQLAFSELGADGWKFLMGAVGSDSLYMKQLVSIMQRSSGKLTLEKRKFEQADADPSKGLRKLAEARTCLAEAYINDSARLHDVGGRARSTWPEVRVVAGGCGSAIWLSRPQARLLNRKEHREEYGG